MLNTLFLFFWFNKKIKPLRKESDQCILQIVIHLIYDFRKVSLKWKIASMILKCVSKSKPNHWQLRVFRTFKKVGLVILSIL